MREVRRYTETAGTAVASEAAATFAAGAHLPAGGIESANGTLMETKDIELVHNEAAQRFEAHVGGQTAFLTYRRFPDRFVMVHTEVPPPLPTGLGCCASASRRPRSSAEVKMPLPGSGPRSVSAGAVPR